MKSDVYGFGVVLLELLTGLRAIDCNRPEGQNNLVNWLRPKLLNKRKLKSIMDPKLGEQYPMKAAQELAQLTLKCLRQDHNSRPSMKEVVELLQQIEAMGASSTSSSSRNAARRAS